MTDQIRDKTIGVRVTPEEYAALKAKADAMAMAPSTFLRVAALERKLPPPPVPAINREAYAELARLAGNLNQLARRANEAGYKSDCALIEATRAEVQKLRAALLGVEQ